MNSSRARGGAGAMAEGMGGRGMLGGLEGVSWDVDVLDEK